MFATFSESMMLARTDIVPVIAAIRDEVEKWKAADAPVVRWRNGPRKAISDALIEQFHALFDLIAVDVAAEDIKRTILNIDAFDDALTQWAEDCDLKPEDADPRGSAALWAAWAEVLDSLSSYRPRKPESIQTLVAEKVSDRQIALIYGWQSESGEPDLQKVQEEKAQPGKHYDPADWVHPAEIRVKAELDQQWAERRDRIDNRIVASRIGLEAPESIEELIEQRVPSKQIASMKHVDVETVRQRAAAMGVPLDGQFVRRVSPVDRLAAMREGEADRDTALGEQMSNEIADSLLDRVLNRYLNGETPQQIAEALRDDHPGLTYQKVSRMIQDAENQKNAPAE